MKIPIIYNLRNLRVRWVSSLMAAVGIGLVVMVFIVVLALARGFQHAVVQTGSPDNALVMRKGSVTEITSYITRDQEAIIRVSSGVAAGEDGDPLVTSDLLVVINHPRRSGGGSHTNISVRGVSPGAFQVREQVRIIEGREFVPGLDEICVGESISRRMMNLDLGDTINFARREWKVVGLFDAGGSVFESEIWGDAEQFIPLFQRNGFQSVTLHLEDTLSFEEVKNALERDPRLTVDVERESVFYSKQSQELVEVIKSLGIFLTIIMSIGAISGALNTMYANVGGRTREIGTLLAIGFKRRSVMVSFVVESVILSVFGGILGCLFSLPVHGQSTGTMNWDSFSEMTFDFQITPAILLSGIIFSIIMGVIGGLWPARQAAKQEIATSIRSL
jgi:ABC-type lipoprotein release transport system permease subunit